MKENNGNFREDIDFVLMWVDGSDPAWQKQKNEYSGCPEDDDRPQRYRDTGLLQYWFRGVEQFAPWARKIHFVTWGHLPEWLDTSHPKLNIVRHSDYMPEEYLPTFSSHPLELNLFRIKGLSEQFVYFNDDTCIVKSVKPGDFFRNGKPVDMLALRPIAATPSNPSMPNIHLNNSLLLSKYFDKRTKMKQMKNKYFHLGYPFKYFMYNCMELAFPLYTGFYTVHGASPILKSTCETLWEKEGALLDEVSRHKFRSPDDVSQYIFREWQKQTGEFVPANLHRDFAWFDIGRNAEKACSVIRGQKRKMICLNDSDFDYDYESVEDMLRDALASVLPRRSSFEKP